VNIIITPDDNLRFIDYDYAGPNPRGVDLATYINETAYELELPEYPFFTHVADEEMTS
jgi:thiamine kinase-like enzyme